MLQEQDFTMLVVKKNLRVSERFPYPVRVEAVLELIDQFPKRKLEKMIRKGKNQRFACVNASLSTSSETLANTNQQTTL